MAEAEEDKSKPLAQSRSSRRAVPNGSLPQSIPEEAEDPKDRRKSLSLSSFKKGFMRRCA